MDILQTVRRFTPDCGVCSFKAVEPLLLSCAAKKRIPDNAQSVIMCIFPYRFADVTSRELSFYACVPDYHIAVGAVLQQMAQACAKIAPQYRFEPFVDNSPIPEVYAAARAGLGVVGEHGLLIHPTYGSYVFLGELVTDMPLEALDTAVQRCDGCGLCATACVGDCIRAGHRDTCVSAISQKKGVLTVEEQALLRKNGLLWGCDRCQEVCPHNQDMVIQPHPCFDTFTPHYIADDPDFARRAYAWRGKAVMERNVRLLRETPVDE